MFFKRKEQNQTAATAPEFIIVGLGNPGKDYELTRHNTGFLTLDHLAYENDVEIKKLKFKAAICDVYIDSHKCILMKPLTFMNNSGEAVREISAFYKIPPQNIIVIFDDITLDCGKLRIKRKGSDGGHNGIKSIIYHLGSDDFPRIKIGIGKKPHPDYNLADWVLSKFSKNDMKLLKDAISKACEAIPMILNGETEKAMNQFN